MAFVLSIFCILPKRDLTFSHFGWYGSIILQGGTPSQRTVLEGRLESTSPPRRGSYRLPDLRSKVRVATSPELPKAPTFWPLTSTLTAPAFPAVTPIASRAS